MRADLRLTTAQHPRALRLQVIARRDDVFDLVTDMVNAAGRVLLQEPFDGLILAQRIEKLDLGVGQFDEHHRYTVVGLVLRRANLGAQRITILCRSGLKVGHGNRNMVQSADHVLGLLFQCPGRAG